MIPFNKPWLTGNELSYIAAAHANGRLSGDGPFTARCHDILKRLYDCSGALLTHSCTAALEMCAALSKLEPGDEVIMPSFTFVSTANAVVMRGAVPVFIDIREDTLNIDESRIAEAITGRTRAILVMHYAGVGCEMDEILRIARHHGLLVLEDAAQGIGASYKGRPLGSIGDLGAVSFHETKNVICGEGGCLLVNDPALMHQAEIIREKGTDRSRFFRGEVDKYTWQAVGSSYLPGELVAAFLLAQLEAVGEITEKRLLRWRRYHDLLAPLESEGRLRRPVIPAHCDHNGHIYHILLNPDSDRERVIERLRRSGIQAVFHYVPLHSSPAGGKYGRAAGGLSRTEDLSSRLLRLPLWLEISEEQQRRICDSLSVALDETPPADKAINP